MISSCVGNSYRLSAPHDNKELMITGTSRWQCYSIRGRRAQQFSNTSAVASHGGHGGTRAVAGDTRQIANNTLHSRARYIRILSWSVNILIISHISIISRLHSFVASAIEWAYFNFLNFSVDIIFFWKFSPVSRYWEPHTAWCAVTM